MMPSNRISALLEDSSNESGRTPAQQEASRRNGSMSRGPVTSKGKAKARTNALKHGLRATVVSPPLDGRRDDERYRQIRRELLAEFQPKTFSQRATIDSLASDHVQLTRARRIVEAAVQPKALATSDQARFVALKIAKSEVVMIDRVLKSLSEGALPICTSNRAAKLAKLVTGAVADIFAYFSVEDATKPADMDPFERAEYDETLHQRNAVKRFRKKLQNIDHVARVFTGSDSATDAEIRAIRLLLQVVRKNSANRYSGGASLIAHAEALASGTYQTQAASPERLILLQRYIGIIERAIQQKTLQLAS